MKDITEPMLKFKEACRHTWNTYFCMADSLMSPDVQKAFSTIEENLFYILVLRPLGISEHAGKYRENTWPWLLITLKDGLKEAPVSFGKTGDWGGVKFNKSIPSNEEAIANLHFFDFFDWYSYGFIDLSLIRAKVSAPDEGFALIEERYCRFFYKQGYD